MIHLSIKNMKNISGKEAWHLLKTVDNSFLVDVRTEAEWNSVGYPDLSSIDKNLIKITWVRDEQNFISELQEAIPNKNAQIIFICKAGGRSAAAAETAISAMYQQCYNLIGGFEMGGWKDNNLPFIMR